MAGKVLRFRTKAERLKQAQAAELRQMVLLFGAENGVSERAVNEIVAAIDREAASASRWTFAMISPAANDAVVEWIIANCKRPQIAVRLWMKLFLHLRYDTGEVVQTRDELAAAVGTSAAEVSRVMSQLEEFGAITRRRDGKSVRYFMNPLVGTHATGAMRDKQQQQAPRLKLVPPAPKPERKRARRPHLSVVPPAE